MKPYVATPRWAALSAALVCALLLVLPGSAVAQGRAARVFLVTFETLGEGVPGVVTSQINRELVDRLEDVRNLELIYRVQAAREAEGAEASAARQNAAIDRAEQLYQAGIGLYVVEDFNGAIASFEEMKALFEENFAEVRNWDMMVDGMARLAECRFKVNESEAAREVLYRVLTVRPDYEINLERSGAGFTDLYNEVYDEVRERTAADLNVVTDIEGATISVDGLEQGLSPVTVAGLVPGEHYVVAEAPDGRLVGAGVVVDARRGADVELTLSAGPAESEAAEEEEGEPRYLRRLRNELAQDHIDDTLLPYLQELATRQGVDFVVVGVVVARDGGYLAQPFIYRSEDGRFGVLEGVLFDTEMANVTVNVYTLSQYVALGVGRFPEELVTGENLLAEPVAAAEPEPETEEPEFAAPDATAFSVPAPAVVAPTAPSPEPEPTSTTAEPAVTESEETVAMAEPEEPAAAELEEPGVSEPEERTGFADPVPPDLQEPSTPPGYGYPPPGYGYPPQQGEQGYPPPGYGYPPPGYGYPPPQGEQGTAPREGEQQGYPPPYYGYPPPQGEQQGYPPPYYGYPPPEGEQQGYPPPYYGYPPPEGEQQGYPPPGYGYPPPAAESSEEGERLAYVEREEYADLEVEEEEEGGRPIYRQWWFWAGTAGVIGVAATTIALLAGGDSGGGSSGFRPELRW